ncbi:MAG: AbrB family transcriptional regulator, partial [Geminicoccaceae bacterium]
MGPDLRHGRPRLLIARATPLVLALLLGAAGGAVFAWLRLPLPWMLGAMTTTMVASVAGLRIGVPNSWRTPMLGVMGVLLGSGFTADVAAGMVRWVPSAASLPVYIVLGLALGLLFLRRFARLDPITAFFGAAPGGLSEMVVMGERA